MKTTRQQKIDWLLKHQDIWQGYPSATVTSTNIYKAMLDAGLFAKMPSGTDAEFVMRGAVSDLIRAAREQRRNTGRLALEIHSFATIGLRYAR